MWAKLANRPDASQISTEIGAFKGEGEKNRPLDSGQETEECKTVKMLAGEKQPNQSRKRAYITAIAQRVPRYTVNTSFTHPAVVNWSDVLPLGLCVQISLCGLFFLLDLAKKNPMLSVF